MTTRLHQMNIRYVPTEDRLLLKISSRQGDEFRLWLTRRYTGLLVNVLHQEMDKNGGGQVLASSDETRRMYKDGAFDKRYEDKHQNYPLGEAGVLAYRIKIANTPDGSLQLDMAPEHGQGISLSLNASLTYMMYNLLSRGVEQAGWNLNTDQPVSREIH